MPVPDHTPYITRGISPSKTCTKVNIADIYNRVELTRHQTNTPPWRTYRHVTNTCDLAQQKRANTNVRLLSETESLPERQSTQQTPDVSTLRPNTAFDVLSQLTFTPQPGAEVDGGYDDRDEASRCVSSQRSEVSGFFLRGSGSSDTRRRPEYSVEPESTREYTVDPRREYSVESAKECRSLSNPARYAASRGFCVRSRSALLRDQEDQQVNSLSRQCCDVLGPKICHQCAIIRRRTRDTRKYESFLPQVDVTEEDLTSALLVAKNYPTLSMEDIQTKLARGEILKPVFKYNVQRIAERKRKERLENNVIARPAPRANRTWNANGATYSFFTSIKDLNDKIIKGQVIRKIILSGDPRIDLAQQQSKSSERGHSNSTGRGQSIGSETHKSISDLSSQSCNSPRKEKIDKRTDFYGPPLVPKVCQNNVLLSAGSQHSYSVEIPN